MQLTFFANLIWVSFVARAADTNCSVVVDSAHRIDSACCCFAWVDTFIPDTCFGLGTIWIYPTFWLRGSCERKKKE